MFAPFALVARAKVNLALHVLARRADGYHDLDSIVAFADVGDDLLFEPAPAFGLTMSGRFASAVPDGDDNIIVRAWEAGQEIAHRRGLILPPVSVHLTKNLPVASGIGGGSADAAAALAGFLRIAGVAAPDDEIMAAALSLGADVPVCLAGKACRMQGVGDRIRPLPRFAPLHALLVNPLVEVATPAVFGKLGLQRGETFGTAIADETDPAGWRNDLAAPAQMLAPVIGEVIATLRRLPGVSRVFMSGSGATCVALHDGLERRLSLPDDWWHVRTILS